MNKKQKLFFFWDFNFTSLSICVECSIIGKKEPMLCMAVNSYQRIKWDCDFYPLYCGLISIQFFFFMKIIKVFNLQFFKKREQTIILFSFSEITFEGDSFFSLRFELPNVFEIEWG